METSNRLQHRSYLKGVPRGFLSLMVVIAMMVLVLVGGRGRAMVQKYRDYIDNVRRDAVRRQREAQSGE